MVDETRAFYSAKEKNMKKGRCPSEKFQQKRPPRMLCILKDDFEICYLPTGKGRRVEKTPRPLFCKRCICGHKCDYSIVDMPRAVRLDIFAFCEIYFAKRQIRYVFALLKLDMIQIRAHAVSISSALAHIERVSVYRKSVSADLYRRVVSLRALR